MIWPGDSPWSWLPNSTNSGKCFVDSLFPETTSSNPPDYTFHVRLHPSYSSAFRKSREMRNLSNHMSSRISPHPAALRAFRARTMRDCSQIGLCTPQTFPRLRDGSGLLRIACRSHDNQTNGASSVSSHENGLVVQQLQEAGDARAIAKIRAGPFYFLILVAFSAPASPVKRNGLVSIPSTNRCVLRGPTHAFLGDIQAAVCRG